MAREFKTKIGPSIFTSRNNATVKLADRYEYVSISSEELYKFGGSRDKDGKCWHLNSIIADETGEYLREPRFRP